MSSNVKYEMMPTHWRIVSIRGQGELEPTAKQKAMALNKLAKVLRRKRIVVAEGSLETEMHFMSFASGNRYMVYTVGARGWKR